MLFGCMAGLQVSTIAEYAGVRVASLAKEFKHSVHWKKVGFESMYESVMNMVHGGVVQCANHDRGPGLIVRLLAAPQEVDLMLKSMDKSSLF